MSFILDALRKSETDRQRQNSPGLVDAGIRPPLQRRAWVAPLLIVVLLANAGLLAWISLQPDSNAQAPTEAAPPVATGQPAVPATPVSGRSLAETAGLAEPEDGPWDTMADMPAVVEEDPVVEQLGPGVAATTEAPPPDSGVQDSLPTARQLMDSGLLSGQALHLDIHVYHSAPAERFVFVNMRRLGEGDELPEGGRIEEITPEGVVVDKNGQRFLLTRD
ncbi:MAG: hypothetical protein FJ197_00515 [Gammaproteobacteria bacterium]|nr:hypothetical protein [Gammaproteobacteria bacterium]